jgi:hypothetical protein
LQASEHAIQSAIVDHLRIRGNSNVFWFAVPNGGSRNGITGAILKREGVRAGVPDLAFVIGGKPHFLEVKRARGYLTKSQRAIRQEIEQSGAAWAVAKGLDEALKQLEQWGALKAA